MACRHGNTAMFCGWCEDQAELDAARLELARMREAMQPLRSEELYMIARRVTPRSCEGLSFVPEWTLALAREIEAAHGISHAGSKPANVVVSGAPRRSI